MSSEYLITNIQTIHWSCFIVTISTLAISFKNENKCTMTAVLLLGSFKVRTCLSHQLEATTVAGFGEKTAGCRAARCGSWSLPVQVLTSLVPLLSRPQPSSSSSATSCGRRATPRRPSLCSRPWSTSHSSSPTV